jgi:hypothetical protein
MDERLTTSFPASATRRRQVVQAGSLGLLGMSRCPASLSIHEDRGRRQYVILLPSCATSRRQRYLCCRVLTVEVMKQRASFFSVANSAKYPGNVASAGMLADFMVHEQQSSTPRSQKGDSRLTNGRQVLRIIGRCVSFILVRKSLTAVFENV